MTFHIELPLVGPEGAEDIHETDIRDIGGTTKHILVVDDEPSIRELMSRELSAEGFDVDVAASGEEGWFKVNERLYDRILLDLKMPGIDGQGLYKRLVELNGEAASRVIFVTGDTLSDETREFLDSTGNAAVSKPFRHDELRKAILRN